MSATASFSRRLALGLVAHAATVLPPALASWGRAMRHEIDYLPKDRYALQWALGCVSTSYRRRIAALNLVQTTSLRSMVALLIGWWATTELPAGRLLYWKVAGPPGLSAGAGAGPRTPLSSMMTDVPAWCFAFCFISSVIYLSAAYYLVRKKFSSIPLLIMASTLGDVACCIQTVIVGHDGSWESLPAVVQSHAPILATQMFLLYLLWQGFKVRGERP